MVNKDKIAIVTGSSAGLGASVAIQLAKKGINVVINYSKNEEEAKKIQKICESYDIETQCHSVFENIRVILEDAGSSWENIVDVQVFLTNIKDDVKIYNKINCFYNLFH